MISDKLRTLPAVTLCLCLTAVAQSKEPVNRITAPIDETSRVTLVGNVHPMAQARFDRGPAPPSTPTGRISLLLQRSAAQQQALTQYLEDLQNPNSPNFHKWLKPSQYGTRFGISDSDLATVESWLQSEGFKIESVPQARNVIRFSGTFAQVQEAFHTSIHAFAVNGESHFASASDPQIPAALAPVVTGVGPLNDFRPKAHPAIGPRGYFDPSTKRIRSELTLPISPTEDILFADPADAATIYDTPNTALNGAYTSGTSWDGTGVNIGIAGDSNIPSGDIQNYRTGFLGESVTNFSLNLPAVVIDGTDPGVIDDPSTLEAILDNEIAGGLAPKAKIYFYASADTDLSWGVVNAMFRAVEDNVVSILSVSFGECEPALGASGNAVINELAEEAAAQGISVVVSSGDAGSAGCDDFDTETAAKYGFAVNGLASTPYTIAVGGNDFDALSSSFSAYVSTDVPGTAPYYRTALKYIPENPWNDSTTVNQTSSQNTAYKNSQGDTDIRAGSGGASALYGKPSFQGNLTPADNARDLPDVSFLAADGMYSALWAVCSDSSADGVTTESFLDCQNTNGQFAVPTTFTGVGGTSAAAPAFAGMLALVSQAQGGVRLGEANYILYQLAKSNGSIFHDVTTGNNSVPCVSGSPNCGTNGFLAGYDAVAGYDLASGLGSVDVKALVNGWASVSLGATSTTLTINGSSASYTGTHGEGVTFDVSTTPSTATGVAAIIDTANQTSGGGTNGPQNDGQVAVPLNNGVGQMTYGGLPGGTYSVSARYSGDTSNAASASAPLSVTITPEASTTTLSVSAYDPLTGLAIPATNIPYGSAIYADAVITGTAEGAKTQGVATGSVKFVNNTSSGTWLVGYGRISSDNVAECKSFGLYFCAIGTGNNVLSASYPGDGSYNASTSNSVAFSVVKDATSLAVTASPATFASTSSTTVTATIATPLNLGSAPTGPIALSFNGSTVATIFPNPVQEQLVGSTWEYVETGTTSIQGDSLPGGSDNLTATYAGDPNYAGSSADLALSISADFLISSNPGMSITPGATTGNTSSVTVTPSGGFTGNVNLACVVTTTLTSPNDPPTCSITSPVNITGTAAATATLTVNTTAATTSAVHHLLERFFAAGGATLAMIFFFGIPARRRSWRALFSAITIMLVGVAIGCGGGGGSNGGGGQRGSPGTTAGTYIVTVTGTDAATGRITANTFVTVTVS